MKAFITALVWLFAANISAAQIQSQHIAISYTAQTVTYHPVAVTADAKELPFIVSKKQNGEVYGLSFKGFPLTAPFIELFDNTGKIIRTLTVSDLFSGKSSNTVKLLSLQSSGSSNRMVSMYEVTIGKENAMLTLSSTATSLIDGTPPAQLLVKIAIKNYTANIASARITIPAVGTVDAREKGFILSGVRAGPAMFGSVSTPVERITAANKKMTITTKPESIGDEKVLLFMTINAAGSKTEADADLRERSVNTPNDIVIVNTSDKESAQPADTVTYRIYCINVGKGPVSDVVITNPIATGTRYLEGSAGGSDTQITFERTEAPLPQTGVVKEISWKFSTPIEVGAEKHVEFKVVIQ
ncbi:MAG: hypothetical protein ACYC09_08025 [Bacteroidota bacterium]